VINDVDTVYDSGGSYRGKGWGVTSLKYQPLQPLKQPIITVGVHIAPQVLREEEGASAQKFAGGNRTMTFRLFRKHDHWVVRELDQPL
jgi:hypothetical protein